MEIKVLNSVLDVALSKMKDARTKAVFSCIPLDEHPALVRSTEQRFIDRLQLLLLPQQTVVARFLVGQDHNFIQSEYRFILFCLLLQDLSKKARSASRLVPARSTYVNTIGHETPCY